MAPLVNIVIIIWLFLNYIIIVPLCIYFTIIYYQRREEDFLQMRRPKLVLICNIVYIYLLAIHIPLFLSTFIFPSHINIINFVPVILAMQIELTLFPLLARVWHTFYDFQLDFANIHRVWSQILINEEIQAYNGSFWVKWKHILNNVRTTAFIFSSIILITAVIFTYVPYIYLYICTCICMCMLVLMLDRIYYVEL